jgi:hypothetical protein
VTALRPVLQPRDWLLLLVALRRIAEGLDPIRVQKGMFLLAREGGLPAGEAYAFRPYNYGPMSDEVYVDLGRLVRAGLCERRAVRGYSWRRYATTGWGDARARALARHARHRTPDAVARLLEIEALLSRTTFAGLLEEVYRRYPEYTSRSVFRRP